MWQLTKTIAFAAICGLDPQSGDRFPRLTNTGELIHFHFL